MGNVADRYTGKLNSEIEMAADCGLKGSMPGGMLMEKVPLAVLSGPENAMNGNGNPSNDPIRVTLTCSGLPTAA